MAPSASDGPPGPDGGEAAPLLTTTSTSAEAAAAPRRGPAAPRPTAYLLVVALTAATAGMCFGFEIGIIDTVLAMASFRVFFGTFAYDEGGTLVPTPHKDSTEGNIVSAFLVGAMAGAVLVSYLADAWGRRRTLVAGALAFCAGGLAQTFASGQPSLYAGRAVSGCSIGILSMCAPLYVSESAPAALRGSLVACVQLLITVGILLASLVNAGLYSAQGLQGDTPWRAALGAQVVPGFLLALLLLVMPESPRWLAAHGHRDAAGRVLGRLRGHPAGGTEVEAELCGIEKQLAHEAGQPMGWRALMQGQGRKRLAIACTLQLWQQATGINVILYYAARLFSELGVPERHAATTLVSVNAALLVVGTLPGIALIDTPRVGRKKLLMYGAAAMCSFHACIAASILAAGPVGDGGQAVAGSAVAGWVAVASMLAFTVAFSATWGPTVWVVQSEIFSSASERAKGGAVATLTNWAVNACIGKAAPVILTAAGAYTYVGFSVICAAMGVYTALCVPETGGRSLEEMGGILS